MRTLINQFLAEMDGNVANNEGILILGATNAPWHLDAAFRRPGRFDRIIFIPPPDEDARIAIIELMAKEKPVEGEVPNPIDPPKGCAFHPRCPFASARCRSELPLLRSAGAGLAACHAVEEGRI